MTPHIIGIAPGKHGGIAAITASRVLACCAMPLHGDEIATSEIADILQPLIVPERTEAVIEKVGAMPKQGVSSTFTFGKGFGILLGVCGTLKLPVRFVTPQVWKTLILAGTSKDKNAAIAHCIRRWPSVSLVPETCRTAHDGMAEALCIAEYGRLLHSL